MSESVLMGMTIEAESDKFICLQQVLSFKNVSKTGVVPTDSKFFVPMGSRNDDDAIGKSLQYDDERS